METVPETDHFKILEEKIEELIKKIHVLKGERETCLKTINEQKNQIAQLSNELNELKEIKNRAKDRVSLILEKMDKLDI